MAHITDDRGYNQVFRPRKAMEIRTQRRAQAILDAMGSAAPRAILELGSGTGELSAFLAEKTGAEVVGADLCEPFVRAAAEKYTRPNLSFKVVDVLGDDLAQRLGSRFDYIVGNGILHHLHDKLPLVLPRLRAILNPSGRLVFWEPNLHNPYVFLIFSFASLRRWAKLEPDEMAFTRADLAATFRAAGFASVEVSRRDFLLPNTPDLLIRPAIAIGNLAERLPVVNGLAQSLFVSAGI
ncbi:MAG TPA: class I SAM-dependent methyltransferase [Polyangia bacterium]|jgi:Cyclopropane fatty acid synthase and related methyltransferases|nr:class I SAM-dependent methyltransferase [Polyangia bacterium]